MLERSTGEFVGALACSSPMALEATTTDVPDLRLTAGGPGIALLQRLGLASPRWRPRRVAVLLAAVTWLPLLVLAWAQGALTTAEGALLRDLATHVRMLVALPVLILVERTIGASLGAAVAQFATAGLVDAEARARYVGLIARAQRLRDSWIAEVLVLIAVCLATYVLFTTKSVHAAGAWLMPGSHTERTPAGYWYGLVSLPIFHLVWLRWLYLLGVWAWFLGRVSRLRLRLDAAHPDGAGGLGFLGVCSVPFGALLFAASAVFAAEGLRRVLFAGEGLEALWAGALMLLVVALAIFIGPLLAFVPVLVRLRRRGVLEYGALASRYTQRFAQKWLGGEPREDLLGTADIQSLADLAGTHECVEKMRFLPPGRREVVAMVIPGLLPLLVLAAAVVPIGEVLKSLVRIFV